jgi:hypothetical protein
VPKPLQNGTGSPRARAFSEVDFYIKPKGNHHQTTTLLVESTGTEQDDDEAPLNPKFPPDKGLPATSTSDGRRLIVLFQLELHSSRNRDTRPTHQRVDPPTFRRTLAILTVFGTDEGAFPRAMAWLNDFDRDGKQERINAAGEAGYGFYLADAKKNGGKYCVADHNPKADALRRKREKDQAQGAVA